MDCSLPGSSVCGIFQARVLEWVAISLTADKKEKLVLQWGRTFYLKFSVRAHLKSNSLKVRVNWNHQHKLVTFLFLKNVSFCILRNISSLFSAVNFVFSEPLRTSQHASLCPDLVFNTVLLKSNDGLLGNSMFCGRENKRDQKHFVVKSNHSFSYLGKYQNACLKHFKMEAESSNCNHLSIKGNKDDIN